MALDLLIKYEFRSVRPRYFDDPTGFEASLSVLVVPVRYRDRQREREGESGRERERERARETIPRLWWCSSSGINVYIVYIHLPSSHMRTYSGFCRVCETMGTSSASMVGCYGAQTARTCVQTIVCQSFLVENGKLYMFAPRMYLAYTNNIRIACFFLFYL